MTFPKLKRVVDKKLLARVKAQRCLACGFATQQTLSDPDHITSRGAGGGDTSDNVWPLCRDHHIERHKLGIKTFARQYPAVLSWLMDHARQDVLE